MSMRYTVALSVWMPAHTTDASPTLKFGAVPDTVSSAPLTVVYVPPIHYPAGYKVSVTGANTPHRLITVEMCAYFSSQRPSRRQ